MANNYCFRFPGTEEDFSKSLNKYPCNDSIYYYFDDYIVKIEDGKYRFGVARGGHSGGYWFLPETSEKDGTLCFEGQIQFVRSNTVEDGVRKPMNSVGEKLLLIVLYPFFLIIKCIALIASFIKKLKRNKKEITVEDKLFDLMVNHLHCNEISMDDSTDDG